MMSLILSKYNKARTIWQILSEHCKRVGVVNMPMGDEGVYDDDDSREMKQLLRNFGYMA